LAIFFGTTTIMSLPNSPTVLDNLLNQTASDLHPAFSYGGVIVSSSEDEIIEAG
jgi:hypothetical protein